MEEKEIKTSHKRLLALISILNERNIAISLDGLAKIAHGEEDEETSPIKDEFFFSVCPSVSKKKIKSRINYLYRYGYLSLKYDERLEDYAYYLSEKGKINADISLIKKKTIEKRQKKTIIIEEEK